jgi:hypothetical protein
LVIAVATLPASVEAVLLFRTVPAVELVHVFVPDDDIVKTNALLVAPAVLVIVMVPVLVPEKVPLAVPGVAFVVIANVFVPLVTEIEVPASGGPENVPVAFDPVPPLDRTRAPFEPLVTEIVVLASGTAENVPVAVDGVALVVMFNVFEPLWIEIEVLVNGGATK